MGRTTASARAARRAAHAGFTPSPSGNHRFAAIGASGSCAISSVSADRVLGLSATRAASLALSATAARPSNEAKRQRVK